eukprot:TRINITY_DN65418_c0_g2_i2.p1 TRINITY_DN65418_c0_g2~~TRINITY_DN65418_c0_g2_i2.p1  ORF type:complete len:810 (+),score=407.68 TRINITY_DN65418_c0_g2_i2:318-2432(+)
MQIAFSAVQKPEVVGLMGCVYSTMTIPVAYLAGSQDMPQVSYFATSPALSDNSTFPYFLRTVAPDSQQVPALLALAGGYGWKNMVCLHSNDDYGRSFADGFVKEAANAGVTVTPVAYDMGKNIDRALKTIEDLNVYVIVVHTTDSVSAVSLPARARGMIGDKVDRKSDKYVWIGTNDFSFDPATMDTATAEDKLNKAEAEAWTGFIGCSVAEPTNWAPWDTFVAKYKPLNGGKAPSNWAARLYDAIYTYAYALHDLIQAGGEYKGNVLLKRLLNTNFDGASGKVTFAGNGDRRGEYKFVNIDGGVSVKRGVYDPVARRLTLSSQVVFADGSTKVPSDVPVRVVYELPTSTTAIGIAMATIGILVSVVTHVVINWQKGHPVIKASSPIFCHLIVLGATCAYIAVIMDGLSRKDHPTTCTMEAWVLSMSFALLFGSLLMKTWRIHKIFHGTKIKVVRITNRDLFAGVLVFMTFDSLVVLLWNTVDKPSVVFTPHPTKQFTDVWKCSSEYSATWIQLLTIPKALMLIFGCVLAYKNRDVSSNFNESKYIAISIYSLIFFNGVTAFLLEMVKGQRDTEHLVVALFVSICYIQVTGVLFGTKFWNIFVSKEWETVGWSTTAKSNKSHSGSEVGGRRRVAKAAAALHKSTRHGRRGSPATPSSAQATVAAVAAVADNTTSRQAETSQTQPDQQDRSATNVTDVTVDVADN